jgi:hypothetical protein
MKTRINTLLVTKSDGSSPFLRLKMAFPTLIGEGTESLVIKTKSAKVETLPNASRYILNQVVVTGIAPEKTTILLSKTNDEKMESFLEENSGFTLVATDSSVLKHYKSLKSAKNHNFLGVLPLPLEEYSLSRGETSNKVKVAWSPLIAIKPQKGDLPNCVVEMIDLSKDYSSSFRGKNIAVVDNNTEANEALACGVPAIILGKDDVIKLGRTGITVGINISEAKVFSKLKEEIQIVSDFNQMKCLGAVTDLVLHAGYEKKNQEILNAISGVNLTNPKANITVGVQIEYGTPEETVDKTIESLINQSYKKFNTILLVNGPKAYAEKLECRYGVPSISTNDLPVECPSNLHQEALETCNTEFYKPIENNDILTENFLKDAVKKIGKSDVYTCSGKALEHSSPSTTLLKTKTALELNAYKDATSTSDVLKAFKGSKVVEDKENKLVSCLDVQVKRPFIRGRVAQAIAIVMLTNGVAHRVNASVAIAGNLYQPTSSIHQTASSFHGDFATNENWGNTPALTGKNSQKFSES